MVGKECKRIGAIVEKGYEFDFVKHSCMPRYCPHVNTCDLARGWLKAVKKAKAEDIAIRAELKPRPRKLTKRQRRALEHFLGEEVEAW